MGPIAVVGVVLIVLGLAALGYRGIAYTSPTPSLAACTVPSCSCYHRSWPGSRTGL